VQTVAAAPILTVDLPSDGLVLAVSGPPLADANQAETAPLSDEFVTVGSVAGWFDAGTAEVGISDELSATQFDRDACIYPDSYLPNPGGGKDGCRFATPGDDSGIFSVPFLALSVWALVVVAGAGFYHGYRRWRARRWLRQLRGRGLALPASGARALAPAASRRIQVTRRSRGSRSRTGSRRQSYGG
jgi:hypothetical protein